jgi:hypothetical protein
MLFGLDSQSVGQEDHYCRVRCSSGTSKNSQDFGVGHYFQVVDVRNDSLVSRELDLQLGILRHWVNRLEAYFKRGGLVHHATSSLYFDIL